MRRFLNLTKHVSLLLAGFSLVHLNSAWGMEKEDDFIPLRAVKTQDTNKRNLITGIKYIIKNGNEFLTRADQEIGSGNVAQWVHINKFENFATNWPEITYLIIEEHPKGCVIKNGNGKYGNGFLTRADQEVGSGNVAQWVHINKFENFATNWPEITYLTIEEHPKGCVIKNGNGKYGNRFLTRADKEVGSGNYAQWVHVDKFGNFATNWPEITYFNITPSCYTLHATIENFQYAVNPTDTLKQHASPISLMAKMTFSNNGNSTLEQCINETRDTTNTVTYSFEESSSLHFSDTFNVHAEANAGFLFFSAKVEATNTFSWDWKKDSKSSQSKTFTETKKHHIQQKITIPPHAHVEAFSMINWSNNVKIPFMADVKITCFADRLKKDGTIVQMVPVDVDAVKLFLQYENYQGEIVRIDANAVYAQVKGTLTADVGFDTIFSTKDIK